MYYTALSDTYVFTKKRFFSGIGKSADQITNHFSPYSDQRNKYKIFIPVDTKTISFDLVIVESSIINRNIYFVLRYAYEPQDGYNSYSFTEGLCTVNLHGAKYSYAPLPTVTYEYEGAYYPEAMTRAVNPINIGRLPYLREKDHLIQIRNPSDIKRTNIFHIHIHQGSVGLIQAGDWLYMNIVSGYNHIKEVITIMYL